MIIISRNVGKNKVPVERLGIFLCLKNNLKKSKL